MAKKSQNKVQSSGEYGRKHPLLVYRFIARRYRPVGVLLLVVGLLALLPLVVSELRPRNFILSYEQLAWLGVFSIAIGILLLLVSWLEARRAFVQCRPEYLLINTATSRVAVAYQRFNALKSVRVGDIFPPKSIKGRDRTFIKPLTGETAIEALISDYPLPEQRIRRRLNRFLFSTRDRGFIFIVPRPSDLRLELDKFIDRARTAAIQAESESYLDPIERMRRR